mmetsp:Transcript_89405/g.139967  ORF Transcript_89405/g.139967 Transcript_89405/m.139967 type:complete len:96 (-) Transcript_89405:86-373(-)
MGLCRVCRVFVMWILTILLHADELIRMLPVTASLWCQMRALFSSVLHWLQVARLRPEALLALLFWKRAILHAVYSPVATGSGLSLYLVGSNLVSM